MLIEIIGSTNGLSTREEILRYTQSHGRICYSAKSFEKLEQEEGTRIGERLLNSGHHSPFDHFVLGLELTDIPKIGAMVLNNEKMYTTSEKSARFTQMKLEKEQEELYNKWKKIFIDLIGKKYGFLSAEKIEKLAQENSRYLTSVFTPTHMTYTVSFRQLSYLVHWFDEFNPTSEFGLRVKEFMNDFNLQIKAMNIYEERLDPKIKRRRLSLFDERKDFAEEFGENYSTTYLGSFAQLAQAHRHRTIGYSIVGIDSLTGKIFVPPILNKSSYISEWIEDIHKEEFPQGLLIRIHEFGNYEGFISKMNERLCGNTQWETMDRTRKTLNKYLEHTNRGEVHVMLEPYSHGPKCTFPGVECKELCEFKKKLGLERLV
ncbi:MAG TPA: FAD-dependent thymidylate synthase [Candidatus Nanoarchaeia archaeon]|nr:FAD-dependent thymidylate synthase [Candidatus Nanoarchaeia archaeon]